VAVLYVTNSAQNVIWLDV